MDYLNVLGIAVALAMDAFAVSVVTGVVVRPLTGRHVFRTAFHFGLFQFMMPVAGWFAGTYLASWTTSWEGYVAFGLLAAIGIKMIIESFGEIKMEQWKDPTRGWRLVALSLATSIDAFAAGMGIAILGSGVFTPAIIIGIVTMVLSVTGVCFGSRIGSVFGRRAILAGGVILILVGIKILLMG